MPNEFFWQVWKHLSFFCERKYLMVRADAWLNLLEMALNFGSYLLAIQWKIKIIYSWDHLFIKFLKVTVKQGTMSDLGIVNTWKNGAFILGKKKDINQII